MSDTYRHKIKGKYNKARSLSNRGFLHWVNWHPFELEVIPIHEKGALVKPVRIGSTVLNFGYHTDGHGIAQFELIPKYYRGYSHCCFRHKSWFHNLFHTRPGRRWNKRQLYKLEIYVDLDTGVWYTNDVEFRNYNKKPETWED